MSKVTVEGPRSCEFLTRFFGEGEEMVDRTFTGDDVIRIFELFLDSEEQEQVEEFFREEPEEPPEDVSNELFNGLRILLELIAQLRVPLPGLLGLAFRFFPFAATLVSTVMFAAERANVVINQLLNLEDVDA